MPTSRWEFIGASLAAVSLASAPLGTLGAASRKLKILFLGGTGFLGPHTVRYALKRGHDVTLFNRGRTNNDLFPELETIIGNRDPEIDEGLDGLRGREWHAVIDTSGYVPRMVDASSVARGRSAMPGRVTQIRPGLIVGPRDGTDRFTCWPVCIAAGGEVLAPGKPSDLTQYIDVRDLARFMVLCLEQELADTCNVVRNPMPFGELLSTCVGTVNPDAGVTWVPA